MEQMDVRIELLNAAVKGHILITESIYNKLIAGCIPRLDTRVVTAIQNDVYWLAYDYGMRFPYRRLWEPGGEIGPRRRTKIHFEKSIVVNTFVRTLVSMPEFVNSIPWETLGAVALGLGEHMNDNNKIVLMGFVYRRIGLLRNSLLEQIEQVLATGKV